MRTFAADYAIGTTAESTLLPVFNTFFKTTFQPTGKYDPFDYTSPTIDIELKTRTNTYRRYPTTMIPYSKVLHAKSSPRTTIFAFNFTDGLYYIEYDPTLFSSFLTNEFQRDDRQDHRDRPQEYLYIPIQSLRPLVPPAEAVGLAPSPRTQA
jgi:hypothetical protein